MIYFYWINKHEKENTKQPTSGMSTRCLRHLQLPLRPRTLLITDVTRLQPFTPGGDNFRENIETLVSYNVHTDGLGLPGPGGFSLWGGGFSLVWVSLPGGFSLPGDPPVNRITHTCKNIILATTSLRPVISGTNPKYQGVTNHSSGSYVSHIRIIPERRVHGSCTSGNMYAHSSKTTCQKLYGNRISHQLYWMKSNPYPHYLSVMKAICVVYFVAFNTHSLCRIYLIDPAILQTDGSTRVVLSNFSEF